MSSTLADRLIRTRIARKMTQEKLAEKVQLSRSAVAQWETDRSIPQIDHVKLLAKVLKVNPGWLAFGHISR